MHKICFITKVEMKVIGTPYSLLIATNSREHAVDVAHWVANNIPHTEENTETISLN